jgi:hypothetical protein
VDWVRLAHQPEEEAKDDGDLVEKAFEGSEELLQLGEGELVVRGSHRRSCLPEVCADGSAGINMLVVLVGVVGVSLPSDLDIDVALIEASGGAQLMQDVIIAVLGFDVVGRR